MIENKVVLKQLQKARCYKCGASLEHAEIVPITSSAIGWVGHAICPACKAESMITITQGGATGIMPVQSDLTGIEYKKFVGIRAVNNDDVLKLHQILKKESIWNLLGKKDKSSGKKRKA